MKETTLRLMAAMNPEELNELIQHAKGLLSIQGSTVTTIAPTKITSTSSRQFVLEVICEYCQHHDLDWRQPTSIEAPGAFTVRAGQLMEFIAKGTSNLTLQRMFLTECLGLLRNAWRPDGVATNATWFTRNIQRIPVVVDVCYPGYVYAGMLPHLVAMMAAGAKNH